MIVLTETVFSSNSIYLDYPASTPVDPRVYEAMAPYFTEIYANPHSNNHLAGIRAEKAVNTARSQIAQAINADPRAVIFTSGATEANNIAIQGLVRAAPSNRREIITLETEHSSVLETVRAMGVEGTQVTVLPVQSSGHVDINLLEEHISEATLLVTVMHVNNETGVVQPVNEIARLCHQGGVLFHSDCAQSLGKLPVDVEDIGGDLITLSAHKAYGPKGIGSLYIGKNAQRAIRPVVFGGGQELGLRSGTLPVPLCVGFGETCQIIARELEDDMHRIEHLAKKFTTGIFEIYPETQLNGSSKKNHRVPGILNLYFPGKSSDEWINAFDGLLISSGSACHSDTVEPSRILLAYGLSESAADSSLRFGIGRFTTEFEIEAALEIIAQGTKGVRRAVSYQVNNQRGGIAL